MITENYQQTKTKKFKTQKITTNNNFLFVFCVSFNTVGFKLHVI